MKWFWQEKTIAKKAQFEDVLQRLIQSQEGSLNGIVTPQTCMQSPTVHAIVTAISRRLAATPIHVFEKSTVDKKDIKERLPSHPVAKLLAKPNQWQSSYDFWQDAASTYIRFGRFFAFKHRGSTGPIRELLPLNPTQVTPKQDPETWRVKYEVSSNGGVNKEYTPDKLFHARGPARDFLNGDSPVNDVSTAIALEILAEKFGANFFKNGALPLLIFNYMEGSAGFESVEQEDAFIKDLNSAFGGDKMLNSMLLPNGIAQPVAANVKHDEAQFLETRKLQRTIIAGAFGVPPHLVGDLERATFNNVEQQDKDFTLNVVMPVARSFECAMERDLLTDADRAANRVIRFNLDSTLRAAFKDRQEGLRVQREMGIISADEWREVEGRNPRDDEFGDTFLHPSNMVIDGEEIDEPEPDDSTGNQGTE
jgi:HK97 family phage portal protein